MAFVTTFLLSACSNTSHDSEKTSSTTPNTTVAKLVDMTSSRRPLVFSHRGTIHDNPEHSFAGYNQAIKDGSSFIEQDVVLSKDGYLFVSHDDDLYRTTGRHITISSSNLKTLDKVRLRNGEHLHQLKDVFSKYKFRVHYIIEAKSDGNNQKTERALAKAIFQAHMTKNVIVQDLHVKGSEVLHSAKGMKQVPILQLLANDTEAKLIEQIKALPEYITFVSTSMNVFTPKINQTIHDRGFLSDVFTIDEYSDNYLVFNQKPDSVFTNETKTTLQFLKKNNMTVAK